jgi:Ni/Fe-hydrogenase 1 B-type cytochrome subunit
MSDKDPSCQYRTYLWEVPVRINHWVNVVCITILAYSGLYIGWPQTFGLDASRYTMGWVRFIHFTAGYVFTVSVLMRIYWSFVGNRYARWQGFFPILTAEGRKQMVEVFKYYTFQSKRVPETEGHNPLAATAYAGVFLCYIAMIATGFAMYSAHAPESFMYKLFGWIFIPFSSQGVRQTHHLLMWVIFSFVINHIYSAWLMDVKERCGEMSSIFSGSKFIHRKEK